MLRRLARVAFHVLTAVSLLLCVAAGFLWVRNLHSAEWMICDFVLDTPIGEMLGTRYEVHADRGRIELYAVAHTRRPWRRRLQSEPGHWTFRRESDETPSGTPEHGVRWRFNSAGIDVEMPAWLLMLACALMPSIWMFARRRSPTRHAGLCPACGYDVRATPSRCPECGRLQIS
jgi:hypothetical protein